MKKYKFVFDGEMPSCIIEFIPFIDELEGAGIVVDRETGHTVNIYKDKITEDFKREIFLSFEYRRICPRNIYYLEEEKDLAPIINVFPLSECPIYGKLKDLSEYIVALSK